MAESSSSNCFTGLLLGAISIALVELVRCRNQRNKLETAYWGERRGRTRVEKEMRRISNIRLNTSEGFFVKPIGYINSCYRQCLGTPRQGMLVPKSRATMTLVKNVSPETLEGLQTFSHVWITFQFHLNTNTLKESKAFDSKSTFAGKISPPMLKKKLGVFATRSPHRPNPFGVTLARIESIDKKKRLINLSACDLVDGTPVLDVKPYVPSYDTVSEDSCMIPDWIRDTIETRNIVHFEESCRAKVCAIQGKLREYKNEPDAFLAAVEETLAVEVRSKFQTKRQMEFSQQGHVTGVLFDEAIVKYLWRDERTFQVVDVTLAKEDETFKEVVENIHKKIAEDELRRAAMESDENNNNNNNNNQLIDVQDTDENTNIDIHAIVSKDVVDISDVVRVSD